MVEIKAGVWVAYNMDNIVMNMDTDLPWFPSKKDAVKQIQFTSMDPRKIPKLTRLSAGMYLYRPKDVDCPSRFGPEEFCIELVTKKNHRFIQQKFESIETGDPLCEDNF